MPAIIDECFDSRSFSLGNQPVRERLYFVKDTEDEEEVREAVITAAPNPYLGLILTNVDVDAVGTRFWEATCRYTRWEDQNQRTFSTMGGTQRLTQSLGTIASYAPPGRTPPDFQGAIGVSQDRIEGVDVITPAMEFTETTYKTPLQMTNAYIFGLIALTGRWNQSAFRFCAAGECLFKGATGAQRGDENWELTFHFAASPNVTGLTLGGITGISKLGWDHLWVWYDLFEDGSAFALVPRADAVYVERISHPGDFSVLGLP